MIPPIYILVTVLVHRPADAGEVLRRGQRRGRPGRGGRSADRRPDHQRDQLAGIVPAPGPRRGVDHRPRAQDRSIRRSTARPPRSTCSARSCRPSDCSSSCSGSCSRAPTGGSAPARTSSIGNTVVIPEGGISPVWVFIAIGALILLWFFLHVRSVERAGREPLLHLRMFGNRTANLGLGTQTIQWLVLQGSFFVISVYLQQVRGLQRHRDRADAHPDHRGDSRCLRRRRTVRPAAPAAVARHCRVSSHDRWHGPSAVAGPG